MRLAKETPTRLSLFWQKNGWLGLIFIAAALPLFGVAAILTAIAERERSAAIETMGTVDSLYIVEPGPVRSGVPNESPGYVVRVVFTVDGQEYLSSQGIAKRDFDKLAEGQTIAVDYLPDDPGRIWVAADNNPWPPDLRFFGTILLLLGLFLVWAPWVVAGNELKKSRTDSTE